MDTRLTEFLFFQSTQENDNYHKLITEIETYVSTPSFKLKYGNTKKISYKAHSNRRNFNKKNASNFKLGSGPRKSNVYHCDFCNKNGHTSDYCFVNPNSKKFKKKTHSEMNCARKANMTAHSYTRDIILDSGATDHFFGDLSMFDGELKKVKESLYSAGGDLLITGKGSVSIETEFSTITFNNVYYVPELKSNLLALRELERKGAKYEYIGGKRYLTLGNKKMAKLNIKDKLLVVEYQKKISRKVSYNIHSSTGHLSTNSLKHLPIKVSPHEDYPCDFCTASKSTRNRPKRNQAKLHRHLYELIHSDICELPILSIDGFKYFASFIDDASRYAHVVLLQKKSDIYKGFLDLIENGQMHISCVRSDQGSEYLSCLLYTSDAADD